MSHRRALRIVLALALPVVAVACGGSEKRVLDQYFGAVNANDSQTLSSFALVKFPNNGKPVQNWRVVSASEQAPVPAPLPELVAKMQAAEAAVNENKKKARNYDLENLNEVEQVRDLLRKNAAVPAKLAPVAAEWKKFNDQDRDLKRALAEARDAVEKEKRTMALSVGHSEGLEDMKGQLLTKQLEVAVNVGGDTKTYDMTLRKYEVSAEKGQRIIPRWMIYSLQVKS
jgi:hypothetical protein